MRKWLQVLPEAKARECANILWACVNLSKQRQQQVNTVWGPTWAAFMQHVQRQSGETRVPQNLANALYAAAKLRKQPPAAELQLLCNMLQHSTGTHIGVCQPLLLSAYRAIATAHSSTS